MQKSFLALFATVGCALLFGCGKQNETASAPTPAPTGTATPAPNDAGGKSKGTIGVSLLTLTNPFFKTIGDTMTEEGKKQGYEVVVVAGENDPARQKDQVKDFIVKKVSAIVLSPCDSRSIGTAIQDANKAGIPVFTADIACLDKTAKVTSHVATDNYSGGKLAGEAMVEAIGGKGKVAILDYPEVESVIQRTKGFKEVVSAHKDIQIVATLPGGGDRDKSFSAAQDILQSNPQLDGIFAINDPSALGAVAALEKTGRADKVKVIGFDGQMEARKAIKDGKIYADAIQYPDKIAQMTIDTIRKYMAGEKVPSEVLIPTQLYHKAEAQADTTVK